MTITAGQLTASIPVNVINDSLVEGGETVVVTLTGVTSGNASLSATPSALTATNTITDDDAAPTISSVTADTQTEGTDLVHTVTLSNASSSSTSFAYSLGGGSATGGGTDYTTPPTFSNGVTLVAGNLIVPAGVTSFTITVPTTLDTIDEGASETYSVSVGGVSNTGTITDDDNAPTISSHRLTCCWRVSDSHSRADVSGAMRHALTPTPQAKRAATSPASESAVANRKLPSAAAPALAACSAPAFVPDTALGKAGRPSPSNRLTLGVLGLGSMGSSAQLFGSQKGAETGLNRITGAIAISWAVVAIVLSSPLIK